eukprot:TRINITY_DN9330_c0_g1_i1.p1 TRINITY_DN9330_c0_g1~~TRINITY_DN9330_c0_g1_i1.p1  ORF type:complete len:245 (-),score=59.01 TRINITY_DN9330_c0_g1_i1:460-1089(-)
MEAIMTTGTVSRASPAHLVLEAASRKQCLQTPPTCLRLPRKALASEQGTVAWSQSFGRSLWSQVRTNGEFAAMAVQSGKAFASSAAAKAVKWVLLPIGDGDVKHLDGDTVETPGILELSNDVSIIGRMKEKADIVINIATVSGAHAQLEKKGETLYVTDLESTNGTYLDNKKLKGGVSYPVEAGAALIFGDEHLAQFRFVQIEEDKPSE